MIFTHLNELCLMKMVTKTKQIINISNKESSDSKHFTLEKKTLTENTNEQVVELYIASDVVVNTARQYYVEYICHKLQ